ncbi:G/U mismatch-specific uracil-DNA glycosylase [Roseateles sp. YR242]|uniref:DNA-deoxyinosine glycosylase n=1 Tax=Roseateles sp. YR242 TaxID=1855305 RepID=UPI0008CC0B43|nr:DNA-deoxyinosine glycosylase [Roseateles sp. YR242]SEL87260.1 G/U mismatch-specific uracil-DNA glycosylase [Roseateles sp. YR242]
MSKVDPATPGLPVPPLRWQGLAPVYAPDARWLLLGSFPGLASLKIQQYYGHPRNQFWRLLGDVKGIALAGLPYEERLAALRHHRIALWDVITETERQGSLDSAIRRPAASDLGRLLQALPALEVIAFNGGTAGRLGLRQLQQLQQQGSLQAHQQGPQQAHQDQQQPVGLLAKLYRVLVLPSSSPAHTMPYDQKLQAWRALAGPGEPPASQG